MGARFFLKGLAIGFSIAAPVGPIGLLCIRRSLAEGAGTGLAVGLGAATADAAYGAVAAFGLTAVSAFLVGGSFWLGLLGGLFLCWLGGGRTFFAQPPGEAAKGAGGSLATAYGSTVFLTLTNPATILSFVAVFAGLGLAASPGYASASMLVAGVFAGSGLWWLILSQGVGLLRQRVTGGWMKCVNQFSGALLAGFGVWAIGHALLPHSH
jgi:threonine/homoserine/homoserine lactone efflux protein